MIEVCYHKEDVVSVPHARSDRSEGISAGLA